jgi:sugar phosphate isomerase/epimerase
MQPQIAAQLYTLRDFTKTPAEIAKTMQRLREIGYEAVQLSALGPIDPKELAKILQAEGLICSATHISQERMNNETAKVIEEHKLWNCSYTAIGGWNPKDKGSTLTWTDWAKDFSIIARKFAGSGISVGYHNHSHELVKFDGKPALQILIEKLDPAVWMEIDTYWIVQGGGDPIEWIDKVAGRIPCVHLKDMLVKHDRTQYMAEVGEGNLNWDGILAACKRAGVKWYIVEQDTCYRDPFESLKISLENLKGMGLS